MEKLQQFGDAMTSIGICVIRGDDGTLLYLNKKIAQMQPDLRLGEKCSRVFPELYDAFPAGLTHCQKDSPRIRYMEAWMGYVQITADAYMWEETIPAYVINVLPQIQTEELREAERYNRMMEKAAMVMSEVVAYGNFTQGTYTQYEELDKNTLHRGLTSDLYENYEKFSELLHPDERLEFRQNFSVERLREQIKNGEKEIYGEFREQQDGRYHWVSLRCIPIENPFDADELCVFIIRDINKRKQMERQLAIQLNATYQSIPGGVAIIQMDERMSIINASQSFYDMMGKATGNYENGYLEHIVYEDRMNVRRKVGIMARVGAPFDILYREEDTHQQIRWVQARGTKISDEDGYPIYLVIRMDVTELKDAQQQLIEEQRQYRNYTEGIIDTLSNLVEFRDLDSGEHIKRTKTLTKILLKKVREKKAGISLSDESIDKISNAAAMHDVGKIVISDTILNKPGRLTREEFEEMKKHTVKGYEILKTLNLSQDEEQRRYSLDISRYHHERWDGNGYPDHLKGEEIPIWSQVVSVVDVYDALVSPRVYKSAYSHEKALEMILNGECGCFNPDLLDCLKESVELLEKEYSKIA